MEENTLKLSRYRVVVSAEVLCSLITGIKNKTNVFTWEIEKRSMSDIQVYKGNIS